MNISTKVGLWLLRKAAYTAAAAAVTTVVGHVTVAAGPDYDFSKLTIAGAVGGLAAAVTGDLRRALLPDLFQIVTGTDPRKDG